MNDPNQLKKDLTNFYGTEKWYRHVLVRSMVYTDGVQYFAENAGSGAYWFLDIVATEIYPLKPQHPFMVVKLLSEDNVPTIIAEDGNDNVVYKRDDIEYTDCPEGVWEFFLTDNVFLLPSEY